MINKFTVLGLLAFGAVALPAAADPACVSGSLASEIGVTCDIGSLTFDFTSWGTGSLSAPASDFTFTVLSNGFTISTTSGTSRSDTDLDLDLGVGAEDYGDLVYNVTDQNGNITGEAVTDNGLSASGSDYSLAEAYDNTTCTSPCSDDAYAFADVLQSQGVVSSYGPTSLLFGSPFSSGSGDAYAFLLEADGPSDTATWDGSTTFTFSTETVVPEPRLAGVLSVMLLGLVAVRRKARC